MRKKERETRSRLLAPSFRPNVHAFSRLSLSLPLPLPPRLSQQKPGRTQVLVYADELVDLEGGHERQARGGREGPASSCCCCSRHRVVFVDDGKKVKFCSLICFFRRQHLLLTSSSKSPALLLETANRSSVALKLRSKALSLSLSVLLLLSCRSKK